MKQTKVLIKNKHIAPFFGDRMTFVRGLDPLGLQNTSERTYSKLMPGLNNVTGKIRYYSFYSWLLHQYSIFSGSTDPKVQQRFIRRAEYIVALTSQFIEEGVGGIPGSLYASKQVESAESSFELESATFNPDGSTAGTYWSFSLGAMGQYYLGSLIDIGLLSRREAHTRVFARTSKKDGVITGEDLAQAFDETISFDTKSLFLTLIESSTVSEEQLKSLLPDFNLGKVHQGSNEQRMLRSMLIQKDFPLLVEDEPTALRKRTIQLLLKYTSERAGNITDRDFTFYAYQNKGVVKDHFDECLTGWYYYQLNEFWQYACTAILNGTMDYLQTEYGPSYVPIGHLVESLSVDIERAIIDWLDIENKSTTVQDVLDLTKDNNPIKLYSESRKSTQINEIVYGFMIIWGLFHQDIKHLERLSAYVFPSLGVNNEFNALNYLAKLSQFYTQPFKEFIKTFLLSHILYRHQLVAYKKMGNGSKSTQKFIIEDNAIRYLGNFNPGFTGPRIGNLIGFLRDLNLIDENYSLTDDAQDLLKEI